MEMEADSVVVYRFFAEEYHADALANGLVWISTLEVCRSYENSEQGDPGEAQENYITDYLTSEDNNAVEIARRAGVKVTPETRFTISRANLRRTLPNAYVVCTTLEYDPLKLTPTFGEFCVRVNDAELFYRHICEQQSKFDKPVAEGVAGPVIYMSRNVRESDRHRIPIGFVKPLDQYSEQKEYRFLWKPCEPESLRPFLLTCPSVKSLCERVA